MNSKVLEMDSINNSMKSEKFVKIKCYKNKF